MIYFFQSFIFFIILSEFMNYSWEFFYSDMIIHDFYIFIFAASLYCNFSFNVLPKKPKLDADLIYKYCLLLLKTPNFFINFFLNTFKKIYLYLYHFKYRQSRFTTKIILKKYLNNFFIIWRPLFKKISYFGYFRSNRSKWIK